MADQTRKIETIRSIETLQLTENLISAMDDAEQAESVAQAIYSLQCLNEQWYYNPNLPTVFIPVSLPYLPIKT